VGSLALAQAAAAQAPSATSFIDSAAAARSAWSRAGAALQHGDTATARNEVALAAEAFPTQPAYIWARAVLAARSRDSATAFLALREYASLGLGRDLAADTTFAWLSKSAAFQVIREAHLRNSRPLANSRIVATLPDSTFWPE